MFMIGSAVKNARVSPRQAPNAKSPVVVRPSADAKNVGQVPNQLLRVRSRRDRARDQTFHQH